MCIFMRMLTNTYWTIIWSALGLQGSAPRGYSCFTAGQVTLPAPFPKPSPRERLHVKATHTGTLDPLNSSGPSCGYQAQHDPTHLNETHLARKRSRLWLFKEKPAHRKWDKALEQLLETVIWYRAKCFHSTKTVKSWFLQRIFLLHWCKKFLCSSWTTLSSGELS